MQEILKKKVEVGDVIESPDFATCWRVEDGRAWVGRSFGGGAQKDQRRAEGKYVVEDVVHFPETEGSSACWKVEARRLKEDGSYDPQGEAIGFYMESDYVTPFIDEVVVVSKLKRVLSFVSDN